MSVRVQCTYGGCAEKRVATVTVNYTDGRVKHYCAFCYAREIGPALTMADPNTYEVYPHERA